MLGYRSPTTVSKTLWSGLWKQVLTTSVEDTNSSVVQVPDCRAAGGTEVKSWCRELDSTSCVRGRQRPYCMRAWEMLWKSVEKDGGGRAEAWLLPVHRSAAEGDRAGCLGTPHDMRALACATGLVVHRQYPGELFTCVQSPCHLCPFTNSHLDYLQK